MEFWAIVAFESLFVVGFIWVIYRKARRIAPPNQSPEPTRSGSA